MSTNLKYFVAMEEPSSESDLAFENSLKEDNSNLWVYDENGLSMQILSRNLAENTFTVAISEDETKVVSIDDVSVCPNNNVSDFVDFKNDIDIFDCFDEDGKFNDDPKFHSMLDECLIFENNEHKERSFHKSDVFITNISCMCIIFNRNSKVFDVSFLNRSYQFHSLNLALKFSYEFNKDLVFFDY